MPNDDAHEPLFRSLLEVDVAAASHPGKVRKNNEDHFLVGRLGRSLELLGTNLPEGDLPPRYEESGWFVVVADGMGGAEAGEVASRIAIEAGLFHHLARPAWFFDGDLGAAGRILDRMRELLDRIQDDVLRVANSDHSLAGMGTTLTVAYLTGGNLFLAHVGDSRAYLYRRGRLNQLTRDQTLVQQLVDQGSIEPEAATKHPLRHVLAHAIGAGEGGPLAAELQHLTLGDGDRLLLCSDGVTEAVDDAALAEILGRATSAQAACDEVLARALDNGGPDNTTVIVADVRLLGGEADTVTMDG
ncbi:MAG: serine/threonine-protein phosphatase [Acidobacteria bacterium]|nr:serine/threonine-protein phosphatase [Acidobacteriota bacterium]